MSDLFRTRPLRPIVHDIDDKGPSAKTVNIDDHALLPGNRPGTQRAFSTVFAPVKPGSPYKDIHEGPGGKVVPAEGATKQTWINFGDAERAQHYVATYAQQHIKSDLQQNFDVGQQAAAVARLMQQRKAMQGKSAGFSSLKTSVKAIEARQASGQLPMKQGTLFDQAASEGTRAKIAAKRLDAWSDTGPVIRGFDVDDKTTHQTLSAAVVEDDKRKTKSAVINVDQTKAANQIGIGGKAKQHLFKGAMPGSLGSVVFNPKRMSDEFATTAGKVSSLSQFEKRHGLGSTIGVIARKTPKPPNPMPIPTATVKRRSKLPKARR